MDDFDFSDLAPEDDNFWDTYYDIENLLDYWQDYRIDHAFVSYQQWADMVIFL